MDKWTLWFRRGLDVYCGNTSEAAALADKKMKEEGVILFQTDLGEEIEKCDGCAYEERLRRVVVGPRGTSHYDTNNTCFDLCEHCVEEF